MSFQTFGAVKVNRSVDGNVLRIGGVSYERGLGAHAVSEIPLSVPEDASRLKGMVGLDDETGGKGNASFRILTGDAVIWDSGPRNAGQPALPFDVEIPPGVTRLYLQTDDLGSNEYDHTNWVTLNWEHADRPVTPAPRQFTNQDFGLVPDVDEDQSLALRAALRCLRQSPGSTLKLERGTYHFWHTQALRRHLHPSNHDQPTWQPVNVPLVDLRNVTIDGQGSLFLFHGQGMPVLIQDTQGLKLQNLAFDYAIPPDSQGIITEVDEESYEMTIDPVAFPHRLERGWITFVGENWENHDGSHGIVFSGETGEIVPGTSDYPYRGAITELAPGRYRVAKNVQKDGLRVGDVITLRHGWDRQHPACLLYRAVDTVMENVVFHASHGMALVAQRSTNFRFSGGGVYPRAETGRKFSAGADATHFSNCRGEIVVENAHFEGMMDDAINVHATCLRIEEKVDSHTLRCRYIHGQAYGFETFLPGETLRYIRAKWLQPVSPQKVKEVVWLDSKTFLLKMEASIPPFIQVGDAVENADWFPSVMFRKNVVRNNRARGSLFTTPLPVVIEGNLFETIAGSAILLAGDANGWYESGACHDVVIRHNTFRNNLTSRFQFTEGILSFYPEIPDVAGQPERYHRNIRIEQNRFETFDVPLLFAISTDGILFRENTIEYNQAYSGWNRPAFILNGCEQVVIENNRVLNSPRPWQKDGMVERMNTPEDEVRFN